MCDFHANIEKFDHDKAQTIAKIGEDMENLKNIGQIYRFATSVLSSTCSVKLGNA